MEQKDYEQEYKDLMAAKEAGRTDGDGPADVEPIFIPEEEVADDE